MNSDRKRLRNNRLTGAWVRFRRQRSGHTIVAAANALSLSQESLLQIENGDSDLAPSCLLLMVNLYWISIPELVELNERLQSELQPGETDSESE